jgi:palmitoyl transferase
MTRPGSTMLKYRWLRLAAIVLFMQAGSLHASVDCSGDPTSTELDWIDRACSRITDTWKRGNDEILFSGFAWHLPGTWTAERRAELNQNAWGGGYGRTIEEANGNTHTVFGLAFLDSHKNVQFNVGYAWFTYWGERKNVQPGLGYTVMIIQRPDIASGIPVPVALPFASVRYDQLTLVTTYIPNLGGGINHGSVLYIFGRYTLDSQYGR